MAAGTKSPIMGNRTLHRLVDSDLVHSLLQSPTAMISGAVLLLLVVAAIAAPLIAPQNTYDLASIRIGDGLLPPLFMEGGQWPYLLGTDDQGRDILSAVLFGMRLSLIVAFSSIILTALLGIVIGLTAGYAQGIVDMVLMRIADVQLTFPSILIALLLNGVISAVLPREVRQDLQIYVVIFSIVIARWPQFARAVRASTMVEKQKEYVLATQIIGTSRIRILAQHILPNVVGPIFVIGTLSVGLAILDEATLSFLGVGLPPTHPSLGLLIRSGQDYLFTGAWWMAIVPGMFLAILIIVINLFGEWLKDTTNPRLR